MKLCRLIVSVLFIAMASCAAAKEAILFLNAHPDDTNGTFLVAPITLGCGVELHLARGAGLLVHGIWRTTRTDPGSDTSEPMPCHGNGDKTLSGAREPRVFDAIGASGLPTMTAAA